MKRNLTLLFALLFLGATSQTVVQKAYLGEDGQVLTKDLESRYLPADYLDLKDEPVYEQAEGWPLKVAAHPNFKNFRGVTLADITGDGIEEILVASFNTLHVFTGSGEVVWTLPLTGTATYPPSVADVTGDGQPDIVQLTGGIPNNGRAYVIDKDGNVLPGWPVSINNNWLLSAPTIADLDGNGQMEIIFGVRTVNEVHVLKADGTSFNENWPVELSSIPAITPSVGDLNNDGELNIIIGSSDGNLYAFNLDAEPLPGFPVQESGTSFSYQSPLLTDFDGEGHLSIVGATHGSSPKYYIRNSDGTFRDGWPKNVPGNDWTYHPPTMADITGDGVYEIFMAKPIGDTPAEMLYGYTPDGEMLDNFPFVKAGGLEGFITVADIDGDGHHELIFGSNLLIGGKGFIHAWKTDGSGELPGFPLRPDGFTFVNGANLGDVTGDGLLNLVALSYEQTFSPADSTVINVYNLGIPLETANVLFSTYKGSNTRTGLMPVPGDTDPDPDPDPVFAAIRFVNAAYHTMDQDITVWYNDSIILENAFFGYASDLLNLEVSEPFELTVASGEGDDLQLIYFETLEMEEDDLWLVIFAGDNPAGPAKEGEFPAGFYINEDFKLQADDPESYDLLFFDAHNQVDFTADYIFYFEHGSEMEMDNFRGEFRGYYTIWNDYFGVTVVGPDGGWIWYNDFFEFEGYEAGDALTFVISEIYNDDYWYNYVDYPTVFLLPKTAGPFIYPGYAINNTEEQKMQDLGLTLYPNPATSHFTLSFEPNTAGSLKVELFDVTGRSVKSNEYVVEQGGLQNRELSVDGLSGLFFVRCTFNDQVFTRKIVVR